MCGDMREALSLVGRELQDLNGHCRLTADGEVNLSAFQSQEFIVGIAVAAIMVSALVASSLFRNLALALAAGVVVLLYLQGGVAALIATSGVVEKEIRSLPDFSNGLVVGLAVSAVLLLGLQKRSA